MLLLLFVFALATAVGYVAIKPIADVQIVEHRHRFQIVDFLALMVYIQVAVVCGMGLSDAARLPAAWWCTVLSVSLWAIAATTARQIGLVASWKRLTWELAVVPATIALMLFAGLMAPSLVLEARSITSVVGAVAIVGGAIYTLRRLSHWIVKDLPKRQRRPVTPPRVPPGEDAR